MTHPPRIGFWEFLRSNIRDNDLHDRLTRLETAMATAAEQINSLSARIDDVAADFRAFRDAMLAERENLTADGQAALDAASAKLAAFDAEVGDADGSDTAAPAEPTA